MAEIYECGICGVVSKTDAHICAPRVRQDIQDYCGTTKERDRMCDSEKEHLGYVCGTCSRPAEQDELVCEPLMTG